MRSVLLVLSKVELFTMSRWSLVAYKLLLQLGEKVAVFLHPDSFHFFGFGDLFELVLRQTAWCFSRRASSCPWIFARGCSCNSFRYHVGHCWVSMLWSANESRWLQVTRPTFPCFLSSLWPSQPIFSLILVAYLVHPSLFWCVVAKWKCTGRLWRRCFVGSHSVLLTAMQTPWVTGLFRFGRKMQVRRLVQINCILQEPLPECPPVETCAAWLALVRSFFPISERMLMVLTPVLYFGSSLIPTTLI